MCKIRLSGRLSTRLVKVYFGWRVRGMQRFKKSFRRHALTVGLLAVAIPLMASFWLQYRSLSKLESTLPTARRAHMRRYLSDVLDKVISHYKQKAKDRLNVPPQIF